MRGSRVGHSRPLGTTTRTRLFDCDEEPQLGGLVYDMPEERKRLYRIVGVEEVGRPGRWNLILERVTWETMIDLNETILFGLVKRDR